MSTIILADTWFDGECLHSTPALVEIDAGMIRAVHTPQPGQHHDVQVGFLTPGLVDAHVHLCLDGHIEDLAERSRLAGAGEADRQAIARRNLERQRVAGVTLVLDAGEKDALPCRLRDDPALADLPRIRAAGWGLRAPGRYGGFFAREWTAATQADLVAAIAAQADVAKLVLTGIIDFAAGTVKGGLQFTTPDVTGLVAALHEAGLKTMAHCSGRAGLDQVIAAGVDGVEHGFFMTAEQLKGLAGRAWTPTWWAVAALAARPYLAGLDAAQAAGLTRILDSHRQRLAEAPSAGVRVLTGTDAGSLGVPHGESLWREIQALIDAGWSLARALAAATSVPRRTWGVSGGHIAVGEPADLAAFAVMPSRDASVLAHADQVWIGGHLVQDLSMVGVC